MGMLLSVLSMIGSGGEVYDHLVHYLAQQAGGHVFVCDVDSPEEITKYLTAPADHGVVVTSRAPSTSLTRIIESTKPGPVLVWRDPVECVIEVMRRHVVPFEQALRAVSLSCATLAHFASSPSVLKVRLRGDGSIEPTTVVNIAHHLTARLEDRQVTEVIVRTNSLIELGKSDAKRLPLSRRPTHPDRAIAEAGSELGPRFDERTRTIVEKCLAGYTALFEGRGIGSMSWPPQMFILGDNQANAPVHAIDITGHHRGLTFGPYLYLPRGHWSGRVPIAVDADALAENFLILVVIDERDIVAEATIEPETPGIYGVFLEFLVEDSGAKVEFRILNCRSCFEGHIALGDVVVTPV